MYNHTHTHTHWSILAWSYVFFKVWLLNNDTPLFPVFLQPLSVNMPCLHYGATESRLKRYVFHLSTVFMPSIRQDIFISIRRDVWPDWAECCELHWWKETIDCQVPGSICTIVASIFIRHCQAAASIFSIGLPHIICSKPKFSHQNVTAHIEIGQQERDWAVIWSPLWKSLCNKRLC